MEIEFKRKEAIVDIKEKIKINPNWAHPCNREKLEYQEKLKFKSGYEFICWMQQNGILKNSTDVSREVSKISMINAGYNSSKAYKDKCAQKKGYDNFNDYRREFLHETGRNLPKEFDEDCSRYFGEFIAENYIIKTFENPVRMPPNNPGFDWLCKKGEKIQCKARCLKYESGHSPRWSYRLADNRGNFNETADWFILSDGIIETL